MSPAEFFPYPTIEPIQGPPTYETLTAVHLCLNANAASVDSELGGGQHGLLGMTISDTSYTILTNETFTPPVKPTITPAIPTKATESQAIAIRLNHTEKLRVWREYNTTQKEFKN